MAYNSKYTGAQVEALLDRAGAAPQTYDIGWLMDLISASGNNTVTLTAVQFNEVKAASDSGKVFTESGTVWRATAGSYSDPDSGDTQDYISLLSAPIDTQGDGDYYGYFPRIMELGVYRMTTASGSVTCGAKIYKTYSLVDKRALSRYALSSEVPNAADLASMDSVNEREPVFHIVEHGNSTSLTLTASDTRKCHIFGGSALAYVTIKDDLTYDEASSDGITGGWKMNAVSKEFVIIIIATKDVSLTIPSSYRWLNGTPPTITAGKTYILSVLDRCAVMGEF